MNQNDFLIDSDRSSDEKIVIIKTNSSSDKNGTCKNKINFTWNRTIWISFLCLFGEIVKVDCKRVRFGSEQVTVSPLTVNALTEDETYHQLKARAKRDASKFDDDLQDSSIALTKNSRLGTAEVAWAKWTSWSQCSESCGTDSVRFRYRLCKNQDSLLREKTSLCSAKDNSKWIEEVNCDVPYCPAGEWGPWYTVQECPKCGYGTMIKQRACMGSNCQGHNLQESVCNTPACVPEWDHWSIWSDCSVDCGGGLKTRKRTCSNGTSVVDTEHCIKDKRDIYIMTGNCNENRCFDMGKLNEVCGKMPLIDEQKRGNNAKLRIYKGEESRLGEIPWQGSWQYRECKSTSGIFWGIFFSKIFRKIVIRTK